MSLTIPDIDALGLTLYRDPSVWPIMNDALQELDPPMRWSQWLERGTLERLAECLVSSQGGRYEQSRFYRLKDWVEKKRHGLPRADWGWEMGRENAVTRNQA